MKSLSLPISVSLSLAAFVLLSLVLSAAGNATTYVMVSDETLVDRAEVIVEVQVISVDRSPDAGRPVTDYLMAVQHVTLGDVVASPLTVRVLGGMLPDGLGLRVHGAPSFTPGQRALLFLKSRPDGTYRILDFMLGAFHLVEHDGQTYALRRLDDAHELKVPGRVAPQVGPRNLDRFRAWLEDRIVGIERNADYFVDSAVNLAPIQQKFTILVGSSNGLKIRWPGFSSNVSYRAHSGGQPGLDGGGFSDASTAVSIWRNDAGSDVRIVYAGTTNATGGLTTFDNVNAFLFGDPNNNDTFDGPFTCNDGGTVAVGGPWFQGTHTHNGETFNTAVGGDIVTNRGLDCLDDGRPWFSQNQRAPEVFAHEVGHTLGFGHSCGDDGTPSCNSELGAAIMNASVQGNRGARLANDDRAGLRFLYGSPLMPPAAPSDLTATATGGREIELRWQDNSSDEQGFDLERRVVGGSFRRIALPAANSTSFLDSTAEPNTSYNYRIRAFNDDGGSAYSNIASATTPGEDAPDDLAAFGASDSQVRLFWTDRSTEEIRFEIEGRRSGTSEAFAFLATVSANSETALIENLLPSTSYDFRVQVVGAGGPLGTSNVASGMTFFTDPEPCVAGPETLCLNDGRFQVEIFWTDPDNRMGSGQDVGLASPDSGLLYFFSANNWEILVKVLDGCGTVFRHFWVFAAATTDVAYDLVVTDTVSGFSKTYSNPQGVASPAITDVMAFPTCFAELPASATEFEGVAQRADTEPTPALMPTSLVGTSTAASSSAIEAGAMEAASPAQIPEKGGCEPNETRFCLNGGRFAVEVEWRDFNDNTGFGQVDPLQSQDSGLQWFFSPENLEILVKVLDGCPINGQVWVFAAATTNVEYTLRVTDTQTDISREYFNPLGRAAAAITDTEAFDACP